MFEPKFFWHGADYNFEQWLDYPNVLTRDIELMKAARCNVMSIGIFSWAMLEPVEGKYEFGWMDGLMDRLAENEIGAILATPSGAKPAWMSQSYPEIRLVDEYGRRHPHHLRHNHCPTSPIYRQKVRQINTLLAERYRDHPALMMWHVSNEYGNQNCRCELCLRAFREWLQMRYGSLEAVNKAWWTAFWSHHYTDWSQIKPVDPSVHGLMLDWMRFVSDQVLDFYLAEKEPLQEITPNVPVTTNFMWPNVGLDYWAFASHVDVISWDSYPRWHSEIEDWRLAADTAFFHDLHRSYKQRPFLLMESTPSVTNWQGVSRPKRPGMHVLASLQAVAHGANSVQYFQWRQSRGGAEKFHGAVVSHAGREQTRTFQEVTAVGELLARLGPVLESVNQADIAIIYDLQNEWALDMAQLPRNKDKNYQERCLAHYRQFWQQGVTVDIINSNFTEFSNYKLVIAPMLYLLQEGVAEWLCEYVQAGGTLVTTYLTGVVNQSDLVFMGGSPGPLKDLLGIWVEETDVLFDHHQQTIQLTNKTLSGANYPVKQYADIVHSQGAEVFAVYEQDFYAGSPAITVNQFGKGRAYYLAARYDDSFLTDFYGWLGKMLGLKSAIAHPLPRGVTAQVRTKDTEKFIFLLNFEPIPQTVKLDVPAAVDALSEQVITGAFTIAGYGFRILKLARGIV
ncbi:MAG: beta-galactosidase [Anaerolineaceae bacterium]|nr:MAG: beta-galactosidase [Anaerolineaceae bacterium]